MMTETPTLERSAANTGPTLYEGLDAMPIGGVWRTGSSGHAAADQDPWTGETLLEITLANVADLDLAFSAAHAAQREWAAAPPGRRADVMRAAAEVMLSRKDEYVRWLVHEVGGTVVRSELEWAYAVRVLHEAASMPHHVEGRIMPTDVPGKESRVYRVPVGVAAVISPWNYPLWLSIRAVAPALAVGNAVVLKPAGEAPVTGGLLLARIFEEAGLPAGLLNVVVGSGADIGDAIVEHPLASVLSFTGSSEVGRALPGKAGVKRVGLELGGNAPLVVLDDAHLGRAVDAAVFGSFFHQGQICVRANRIVLDASIHDQFVERFIGRVRELRTGDPSDPATAIGPVINHHQLSSILEKVDRAQRQGAEVVLGGEAWGPTGLCLPPHVLLADNDVATAREEVFGPVITIIRADDERHALEIANDSEYGLSSAVFTQDERRGLRFALQVEAGMTHINDAPGNDDPNTAFGGEKASGLGRFGGAWAIEEFTTDHWITVQHEPRRYPI